MEEGGDGNGAGPDAGRGTGGGVVGFAGSVCFFMGCGGGGGVGVGAGDSAEFTRGECF